MTNSMNRNKNFITPEKAAWFIPVLISSGISILIILFFVIPEYVKSNMANLDLNGLIQKKNKLNDLKLEYKLINQKFSKLDKERSKIIELISGKSNLDTLLAKVGEIGKKNNIEFISIVPKKIMVYVEKVNNTNNSSVNEKVNLNIDPLLVEGTKKYLIDFTFKSYFSDLLEFLRELEFQENLILLNNIDLKLEGNNISKIGIDESEGMLKVKLSFTFYGKN